MDPGTINSVTIVFRTTAFAGRWDPQGRNTDGFQSRDIPCETSEMLSICCNVPFKRLHHRPILRCCISILFRWTISSTSIAGIQSPRWEVFIAFSILSLGRGNWVRVFLKLKKECFEKEIGIISSYSFWPRICGVLTFKAYFGNDAPLSSILPITWVPSHPIKREWKREWAVTYDALQRGQKPKTVTKYIASDRK